MTYPGFLERPPRAELRDVVPNRLAAFLLPGIAAGTRLGACEAM